MKARLALITVVALTVASLSTIFASAGHRDPSDGNDRRGKLDIRRVRMWGSAHKPGWSITVFRRFSNKEMRDNGFFLIQLDTVGDVHFDYYALVGSNGRGIQGSLWRDRKKKRDRRIGKLAAWRPRDDRKTVTVRIPLSKLRTGGDTRLTYRWFVKTIFVGRGCRRVCIDRVPNKNSITDPNGKPTPSPTEGLDATESPAPTPSPEVTGSSAATPSPEVTESPPATESP
ncbi:MAG: hypothetical protein ACRDJL_11315 [Actinomycetota bacterium]